MQTIYVGIKMPVQLNHLIIAAHNKQESAHFLAELLNLDAPVSAGIFLAVKLDNHVTLDYVETPMDFPPQHYAFLVSDDVFDAAFSRIREQGIQHWADPRRARPNEINTNDGGRGVYFLDPSGHYLEIITRPYGGGAILTSQTIP
jgi:catechol 2,3-dioxygenase-like lactoylglutathione lyase family enzyme